MASDIYHEPLELLSGDTRDMHRAIVLMEELEAIDCPSVTRGTTRTRSTST